MAPADYSWPQDLPEGAVATRAAELTYPATDLNVDTGLFAAVQDVLGGQVQSQLGGQFRMTGPPDASGSVQGESMLFRMTTSDQTVSVSAWPTSLVIECSEYERYAQFRDLVVAAVDAYARFMTPTAISRFGLRYIDEMHVDEPIASVSDWKSYVNEALLAPSGLVRQRVLNLALGFTVDFAEHRTVNVRCTTTPSRALASEGHLRLRERPDTPAFVVDIDAVYQPPQPLRAAVTGEFVAGLADQLRPGVRDVFDTVFTPRALQTFRTGAEEKA